MQVRKALITAAGRGARLYPATSTVQKAMLPLIDRDGVAKPVIQIIAEEALASGIEEICILCAPGDEEQYLAQFGLLRESLLAAHQGGSWAEAQADRIGDLLARLHFAVQEEPRGYGHAVYCGRHFVGSEPFMLLLGDHLYVPRENGTHCAELVMGLATQAKCAVSTVQSTREHLIGNYGTLAGVHVPDLPGVYQIERIVEKPSVSLAELELQTPGLRVGHYLCLLGMHVLTPEILEVLGESIESDGGSEGEYQLTPALHELAQRQKCLALEVDGRWCDIGQRYGLLRTQIALGMAGADHTEVLGAIADLLTEARLGRAIERVS